MIPRLRTQTWLGNHCDGAGPHNGPDEVRLLPLGGGANLILCRACFAHENEYRARRGRETGAPENWPVVEWGAAKVYATEAKGSL